MKTAFDGHASGLDRAEEGICELDYNKNYSNCNTKRQKKENKRLEWNGEG